LPWVGRLAKPYGAMATVGFLSFPRNGYDAVIFDCDGTLVDSMSAHFEAWCDALAVYGAGGVLREDVFLAMGGRPSRDIVMELNDHYGLKLDPAAMALAKREAFFKRMGSITLIDEVAAFAKSLRGRMPMAVATGSNRRVVEKTLQMLGISDWFDEVVTSEDVVEGKPAPDVFLYAAKLLGVAPARCLVLEDAPAGILAAQRAGMQVMTIPMPQAAARA
jgi:HAD superfamily hydrolase (TIGR01509 family)